MSSGPPELEMPMLENDEVKEAFQDCYPDKPLQLPR